MSRIPQLIICAVLLLTPVDAKPRRRQSQHPTPPKPFTAAWYDYQCRVKGAICPPAPRCEPYVIEGVVQAANKTCK